MATCLQLTMEDFSFAASSDTVDVEGRYVQPGTFSVVVGDQVAKFRLAGDPLRMKDWTRIDLGYQGVTWPPAEGSDDMRSLMY
jgi:hypothetical protein